MGKSGVITEKSKENKAYQKKLLEDYAREQGFTNCVHFTDGPVKIGLNQKHPPARGALV